MKEIALAALVFLVMGSAVGQEMEEAGMENLIKYLDGIVEPTIDDFRSNPASVRHAFLACVAVFHSIDYLAFPRSGRGLRQELGNKSPDFKLVDDVAHAFKHVVAGNPNEPRLKAEQVIMRTGAFQAGAFDPLAFDVGAVTLTEPPGVNLLRTVEQAVHFLREYTS
jgi:hypothetical protein